MSVRLPVDTPRDALTALVCRKIHDSGWAVGRIAAAAGVSDGTLSNIIWGNRHAGITTAWRILTALGYQLVFTAEPLDPQR